LFITSKTKYINKGIFKTDGPFYFGVICNKLGSITSDRGLLKISKGGELNVGKNVRISSGCKIHVNGNISIGDNTYIMPHTLIAVNDSLKIGSNCAISWNCQIMDNDGHDFTIGGDNKPSVAAIVISDNVWIGNNCIIKKGVTIGKGAVVASGSVVDKDVRERTVVAGMPAKVIRENIDWK
jgi:acetyltransferase-like isoleucine patch superfamily enzyme